MSDTLSTISEISIYVVMGLYAVAFIAFAFDLARRSAQASEPAAVPSAVQRRAAGAGGAQLNATTAVAATATATLEAPSGAAGSSTGSGGVDAPTRRRSTASLRVAMWVTTVAWVIHLLADVTRGVAAHRVPWANMWEFSLTGTLVIVGIFLLAAWRLKLAWVGSFVMGLVCVLLMIAQTRYYVPVVPLPPPLQSYWLVIHILVAILGTAFFALGFAVALVQLLQARRERQEALSLPQQLPFLKTLPDSNALENLTYRVNIIGFIFWTFTLIAGAIWAEKAWGRYWGWDTKEVWTFIIWVIYAGYIHARATRGWRGTRSAWLSLIGFAAVMFNFGIVNVFFHGLHSYSGLSS